jgi:hypothetical protein
MAPEPGDEGYDDYVIAKNEQKKAQKEARAFKKQQTENYMKSGQVANEFIKANRLTEEQGAKVFKAIDDDITNLSKGIFTQEYLKQKLNGLNYKTDIVVAEARGETIGKNKKIIIQKKGKKGDGIPSLQSGRSLQSKREAPRDEVDDYLDSSTSRRKNTNW